MSGRDRPDDWPPGVHGLFVLALWFGAILVCVAACEAVEAALRLANAIRTPAPG